MLQKILDAATDTTPGKIVTEADNGNNSKTFNQATTFQINTTGVPTALTVSIKASIDGENFHEIILHDVIADGNIFHLGDRPVTSIQANIASISGGTTPSVTLFIGN